MIDDLFLYDTNIHTGSHYGWHILQDHNKQIISNGTGLQIYLKI